MSHNRILIPKIMPRFRASQADDPWVVEMADYASVPVENSVALFAYFDIEDATPHIKKRPPPAVSADATLRALQAVNRYAVAQEIRNEDAVAVLVAQMKSICAKYRPAILEILREAETKREAEEAQQKAEKEAEEARQKVVREAEEARQKAERAAEQARAYARWVEDQRILMNASVAKMLGEHPNLRTLKHNYTEYEGSNMLFAAYKENKKTGERTLQLLRIVEGGIQRAHDQHRLGYVEPFVLIPESWATHYEEGKVPFLPICPTCKRTPRVHVDGHVECAEHYKWDPLTDKHSMWKRMPPRDPSLPPSMMFVPSGYWVAWDPKDPDGAIAARAAKDKQIAEAEEQIRKLQAQIAELRKA